MSDALMEIDAKTAKGWLDQEQAVLIVIRESDEFAREHIPEAHSVPLSGFDAADFPRDHDKVAIFHCASGNQSLETTGI